MAILYLIIKMKAQEIIKLAVQNVNLQLKAKEKIKFQKKFQIFGPNSSLDSLIIVNLFLEIENICKKEFKKNINFLNDNLFQDFSKKKYFLSSLEKDLKIKLKKNKKR